MSIVRLCPYAKDEHCKYERYYGEPLFSKCKNCEIKNNCRYETKKKRQQGGKNESKTVWDMFLRPLRIMYYKHQIKKLELIAGEKQNDKN